MFYKMYSACLQLGHRNLSSLSTLYIDYQEGNCLRRDCSISTVTNAAMRLYGESRKNTAINITNVLGYIFV